MRPHSLRIPLLATSVTLLFASVVFGSSARTLTTPSTAGLLAIGTGQAATISSSGYAVVVLNRWDEGLIPSIRAAQPSAHILLYQDISSTRSYACGHGIDDALLPTGIGYCWARDHHPRWFLRDTVGRRVEWRGYEGHWWMDVGRPVYQRTWAKNVIAALSQGGWDGVMADNAISTPAYYLHFGQQLQRYPTSESYALATEQFLAAVGPQVQAAGFEFLPNIGGADLGPGQLARWLPLTSGVLREFWARYGTGDGPPFTEWDWNRMIEQMEVVEGAGKTFLAVTYGDLSNTRLMRYALASFLIAWSGKDGALFYRPDDAVDPWAADWTMSIGEPIGPRTAVGNAWLRYFTDGVAVVNPSTVPQDVPLGGTFLTPEGTPVTTISLPAGTGAVLRAEM
jgi:Hypothetical glycosyl hydrolase family 15